MNAPYMLDDEQWQRLIEQTARAFNEVTLSRGFTYFKQQRVQSLTVSGDRVLQALVTGTERYKVTLNLDSIGTGACTCPMRNACKHQAAVLMELADRMGYPAARIVNAKHHVQREDSASLKEMVRLPGMDAAGWHEFLRAYTASVNTSYDYRFYANSLRSRFDQLPKNAIRLPAIDWLYFELHQELFILRRIRELKSGAGTSYFTSYAIYEAYDEFFDWLRHKTSRFHFPGSIERLKQTLDYVKRQMSAENDHSYLDFNVYTALWKLWISSLPEADDWLTEELEDLEKSEAYSRSTSIAAATAFLYLRQSKGAEAWEALASSGTLDQAPTRLFVPLLKQIAANRDWANLTEWLAKTSSHFYGGTYAELEGYMGYWKEAVEHLPDSEAHMWLVLESMLPRSIRIIEDMLYERRKWKMWLELQIARGQDPFYHRVSVLQPIEKEAPELLLPYYHQAVEHYVSLKNRHDYKQAVKLLKRLGKVYKKMKQTERWELFLGRFMDRHSRLRALQEELKKGKLSS